MTRFPQTPRHRANAAGSDNGHRDSIPSPRPDRARRAVIALLGAVVAVPAAAELPWLPPKGSLTLAIEVEEASAETFYTADEDVKLVQGGISAQANRVTATFSLSDHWAIDGSVGNVDVTAPLLGESAGTGETRLGLNWRLLDEQVVPGPSIALRLGWIGAGDYPSDRVHAPGPGSGGYAVSIAIGKVFREALSFSATVGGRSYEDPVPAVISTKVSAALLSQPATLERILGGMEGGVILRGTYQWDISTGDLDLADPYPPFDIKTSEFPELGREFSRGAVAIAVAAGPVEVAAEAFQYTGGRNVGANKGVAVRITANADLATLLGSL